MRKPAEARIAGADIIDREPDTELGITPARAIAKVFGESLLRSSCAGSREELVQPAGDGPHLAR